MTEHVIEFLPYQKAWINDKSRFKIGKMTRRGGKTFGTCGECVDDCIQAEINGTRDRWTILSRSENTAKEAIEEAIKPMTKAYYEVYGSLVKKGQPEFSEEDFIVPAHKREVVQNGQAHLIDVEEATYKAQEVRFPTGSRITAISASPDAVRGFGGNLILDEFAFHADARRIWASAFPVIIRNNNKLRVISTPNGKGNKFHELMTTEGNNWSKHVVDIYEAVKQGLDVDPEELRLALNDQDAWDQEFLLKWMDAASAWLPYELISSCEARLAGHPALYGGGPCFVGVDIAARNDLFVIWVLELVGGHLVTREIIAEKRITFARQDELLADVFRRYRVVRCAMDQTGMGEKPVEDAKRNHGESRVEGVLFSATSKLALASGLKDGMEDRRVLIPEGQPELRADLHAIKSTTGQSGIRRLVADGSTDGHADRFWAAALAVAASETEYQPMVYTPVPPDFTQAVERDIKITGGFRAQKGAW